MCQHSAEHRRRIIVADASDHDTVSTRRLVICVGARFEDGELKIGLLGVGELKFLVI